MRLSLEPLPAEIPSALKKRVERAIKKFMRESGISLVDVVQKLSLGDQMDHNIVVFYGIHLILRIPPRGEIEEVWKGLTIKNE